MEREETMININRLVDCGNSPKNQLVHDYCICFLLATCQNSDASTLDRQKDLLDLFDPRGKEEFKRCAITQITMISAISHGKIGVAEFQVVGGDGKIEKGCLVVEFQSASAKKITSLTEYVHQSRLE